MKTFEDLLVFKRAYKVSLEIHQISMTMPKSEQFGMADQLRRASKSICANLAEGWGKQHISDKEFKRFVSMSIGSANEMRVWLRYCLDLGYLQENDWSRLKDEYIEIAKMLSGLHRNWQ